MMILKPLSIIKIIMAVLFQEKNRHWQSIPVVFTIGTRRSLQNKIGNRAMSQVMMDDMTDELAIDCFYECCRKGLDEHGISREDFEDQIDGDKLADLEAAFLEAVVNFTKPAEREEKRNALIRGREQLQRAKSKLMATAVSNLETKLNELTNSDSLPSTKPSTVSAPTT